MLLQDGNEFRLPGGHLRAGESEQDGLRRKLTACLSPVNGPSEWEIGELLSTWWRPNFEVHEYPYIPSHCARAKECRKIYIVPLPAKAKFAVPKNRKLLAVPLFDVLVEQQQFGTTIASIPHLVSRFTFTLVDASSVIPKTEVLKVATPAPEAVAEADKGVAVDDAEESQQKRRKIEAAEETPTEAASDATEKDSAEAADAGGDADVTMVD